METALALLPTSEIVEGLKVHIAHPQEDHILSALEDAVNFFPLKGEQSRRQDALKGLVHAYFKEKMGKQYWEIDSQIMELRRGIVYTSSNKRKCSLEIPVFASANVEEGKPWEYEVEVNSSSDYPSDYRRERVKISSSVPPIPKAIKQKGREALVFTHRIYADALQKPRLGELLLEDRAKYADPTKGKLFVLWKPRPEDLSIDVEVIRDPDPILALDTQVGLYLVATWDDPNEEPYQQFLNARANRCLQFAQ
ncbi:hypothetical protein HZB00_03310 [Candidatus Woesearchaeota archaeon]|nr:hypothetical protein [Candidatus Woesearchaeota archaeon]